MSAADSHSNKLVVRPADGDVVLGDDWVGGQAEVSGRLKGARKRRGILALNQSPLARKIVAFNLLALAILVAGILYLNPSKDSLVDQRAGALSAMSELVADVLETRLAGEGVQALGTAQAALLQDTLEQTSLRGGHRVFVLGGDGSVLATAQPQMTAADNSGGADGQSLIITDALDYLWNALKVAIGADNIQNPNAVAPQMLAQMVAADALNGARTVKTGEDALGGTLFAVGAPIELGGKVIGSVALTSAEGEIDRLIKVEREQVLKMFVVAILVSIGLSLVLASLIANPLSDLADAAEIGRDKNCSGVSHNRIRIPDLTARSDEIGRLSGALRSMVGALYERIESNEQFAADVAHEIKNPLASLRSAVGTLRVAKRDDQRERLLEVIDHDVRRLDRLVSDISNASRLDSELVKEEEERFDLTKMLGNLAEYLGQEANGKGVDFITDLPERPIVISGLEARLAQVFVNLISNAISFCEQGDAIRLWARVKESRVLVVVEDTGPGIPEQALSKIFKRFYSERPEGQFGNNSGLGLAISKQIVEAHGGVIWAENIRPTDADIMSEPLGARFVVGMPL
jgi:two-component system sensor histidine kinase ChvG